VVESKLLPRSHRRFQGEEQVKQNKLIKQAKSLAAAMFDPLGNTGEDNMVMSNKDAQEAAEIIYGLIALLEDDSPEWTAKDFAKAVPFQVIAREVFNKQLESHCKALNNVETAYKAGRLEALEEAARWCDDYAAECAANENWEAEDVSLINAAAIRGLK
jgi:hypothetical protein